MNLSNHTRETFVLEWMSSCYIHGLEREMRFLKENKAEGPERERKKQMWIGGTSREVTFGPTCSGDRVTHVQWVLKAGRGILPSSWSRSSHRQCDCGEGVGGEWWEMRSEKRWGPRPSLGLLVGHHETSEFWAEGWHDLAYVLTESLWVTSEELFSKMMCSD